MERVGQVHPTSLFPAFQGRQHPGWEDAGSSRAFLIGIHLCSWELHVSGGWGQDAEVFDCFGV